MRCAGAPHLAFEPLDARFDLPAVEAAPAIALAPLNAVTAGPLALGWNVGAQRSPRFFGAAATRWEPHARGRFARRHRRVRTMTVWWTVCTWTAAARGRRSG